MQLFFRVRNWLWFIYIFYCLVIFLSEVVFLLLCISGFLFGDSEFSAHFQTVCFMAFWRNMPTVYSVKHFMHIKKKRSVKVLSARDYTMRPLSLHDVSCLWNEDPLLWCSAFAAERSVHGPLIFHQCSVSRSQEFLYWWWMFTIASIGWNNLSLHNIVVDCFLSFDDT